MLVDNDKQFPIRQNYKGGKWEFVENDKVSWDYYFKRKSKSKIPVVIISLIPLILIPFIISCVFLVYLNYCMKLEIINLLFYSNLQDRKKKGIYNSGTLVISIFIRFNTYWHWAERSWVDPKVNHFEYLMFYFFKPKNKTIP